MFAKGKKNGTKDYSLFKNGDRRYSMDYNKKHGIPLTVILNCTKTNCKIDHNHWCAKCRLHYRLVHKCVDSFPYVDRNGKTKIHYN